VVTVAAEASLTARGAARVRGGHPWVPRAEVAVAPAGEDAVAVRDERGRVVASALWAPEPAPIALRVYARGEAFVPFDEALLGERLDRALARRRAIYGDLPEACRLVHAEADQLPGLFVDKWGDCAVLQTGTGAMDRREPLLARLLAERLGARLIIARDDGSVREHEGLPRTKGVLLGAGPTLIEVRDGAARMEHDLLEDAKTGGFLDQRENHRRAAQLAHGDCLDAFSHHGGFALAMAPRAASVLAVEQDARAAARAARNALASGFAHVKVETADAFAALRAYERSGRQFDVVVVDPPALAKRGSGAPGPRGGRLPPDQALRAYKELNLRALRITRRDGFLITCSCSAKVTSELFGAVLADASRDAHREAVILERRGAAADHPVLVGVPETEYLKCWILQVL
jgi:23S rRNA (cytosine1962-C5)-methyltransferase